MSRLLRFTFASLLVLGLCSLSALAQSQATSGQISGEVVDANGAAVANAVRDALGLPGGVGQLPLTPARVCALASTAGGAA